MSLYRANVVELAANAVRTSTLTATGFEIRPYAGIAQLTLQSSAATAGSSPTLDVTIEESDALASGYTAVSGAVFAEVTGAADVTEMIAINTDELKPYIRVVGTIGGTATPTFGFGVSMLGMLQAGRNASQVV
jgi:hypothetical protein